ncbi:hypothetical protein [Paenibacillus lentus]|uniref:Uncharacterized protein n=1 Tax=Paenibacillus lentus TaxID=1338368 RepID=A0A3S8S0N5_9BACL|nr:hypothetical protein [Paenibacillus lentus]AZK48705.1 hypothetical protein EIM92_23055 [Paenibacillus lentus]
MPTANEIIRLNEIERMDKKAKKAGFLPLISGEAYEAQYNSNSHVFIMIKGGKWSAWRETWQPGKGHSISIRSIVNKVPFDIAVQQANKYMAFITKKRGW